MNTRRRTELLLTLALLAAPPAAAQRSRGGGGDTDDDVWKVLAEKYDANADGKITAAEYPRGKSKFSAFDENADGVLTPEDFESMGGMSFARRMLGRTLRVADIDEDGKIVTEEWKAFLDTLEADGSGVIPDDVVAATFTSSGRNAPGRGRRGGSGNLDRDGDGKTEISDLERIFVEVDLNGDGVLAPQELEGMSSRDRAPKAGQVAPDFELAYAGDEERKVRLSSFKGERPVALVFGSYT